MMRGGKCVRALAERLRMLPGLGPGQAQAAADEDVGVVDGFFVSDTERDVDGGGHGALPEVALLVRQVAADHDDGF